MRPHWEILASLINNNSYTVAAEIGVRNGENACNILRLCPNLSKIYLIDIDMGVFDYGRFHNYIHRYELINKSSIEAAKVTPNELDLVFVDAEHAYLAVKEDITAWYPKIRTGGTICGHDYGTIHGCSEVKRGVDEMFSSVSTEPDILENGEIKVWWVKK